MVVTRAALGPFLFNRPPKLALRERGGGRNRIRRSHSNEARRRLVPAADIRNSLYGDQSVSWATTSWLQPGERQPFVCGSLSRVMIFLKAPLDTAVPIPQGGAAPPIEGRPTDTDDRPLPPARCNLAD